MKLLLLLGFGWATVARGQGVAPAEPRFYVGLQACYMHYPGLEFGTSGTHSLPKSIYPIAGTIGYRINANYSIEASFTGCFPAMQRDTAGGSSVEYRSSAYAVTFLVRRNLFPAHWGGPWGTSVTAGLAGVSTTQDVRAYFKNGGSSSTSFISNGSAQLAIGVGMRYRLSPHWQLTADAQGVIYLFDSGFIFSSRTNGLGNVGGGATAGVRYSF